MTQKIFKFHIYSFAIFSCILLLCSCNDGDHTNSVPRNSIMIASLNADDAFVRHLTDIDISKDNLTDAIDIEKKVYLFETADGTFGMCVPVKDEYAIDEYLHNIKGKTNNFNDHDGYAFCTYNNNWLIGYSSNTLIVMGPIIPSERAKTVRRISRLLAQEEDSSIKKSPLWEHLNETPDGRQAKIAIQANALPEQIVPTFMIGAPRGTATDDIIVEAMLTLKDSALVLKGHTCSYNTNVKQRLEQEQKIYRPLNVKWSTMAQDAMVGIFMNVDGKVLMPYINDNKALNTLLLGTDAYDIIRKTDGNISIHINNGEKLSVKEYDATTDNKASSAEDERLVITLNLNSLTGNKDIGSLPILGNIKQIIYSLAE